MSMMGFVNLTFAADDFKVIKLEQDVRNLERQVQTLTREVSVLQRQLAHASEAPAAPARAASPTPDVSSGWLNAANWKRIQPGMSELEVIDILGAPTSMRASHEQRVLMYAVEIGTSGFLSGSVQLANRQVTSVQTPVLK
jgi:hypothetical protein